ncbi:MAG: CoA pyrophosphatase [Candidatus Nitrosocaldaceae archaeon]
MSLISLLKSIRVEPRISNERIQAAVMVIFHINNSKPYILLTKRSSTLKNHASQISFPGGVRENDEELIDTAIREVREELGLIINKEQVISVLESVNTLTSNFCIVPFVSIIDNTSIAPNRDEIDEVIFADLYTLFSNRSIYERDGIIDYRFIYNEHVIWGATARILNNLYKILEPYINNLESSYNKLLL